MSFDIIWFINFGLLLFAAGMAISLIRLTKMSKSWLIICLGLVVMSMRSIIQIINFFVPSFGFDTHQPYSIGSVIVSVCFAAGVYTIRKMYIIINQTEAREREFEKMLLNTTIMTEENERRRFAIDLHDGLGPLLSSIKMSFSAVADDVSDKNIRHNLELAINEAISTVREVSNNMSPHILSNFGICKAIMNFVGKLTLSKEMKISYNIAIDESKRYSATNEIVMYRVFCELINNTFKHANATAINFRLEESKGWLLLTYKDNGTGFNPEKLKQEQRTGIGLYNIVSRISSIKGKYVFKAGGEAEAGSLPAEEHGMVAEIFLPLND